MTGDRDRELGQLSAGARAVMDELTADLRAQVLSRARAISSRTGAPEPISAADVLRAFEDVVGNPQRRDSVSSAARTSAWLAGVGISTSSVIVLVLLGGNVEPAAVVAAAVGLAGAALAVIGPRLTRIGSVTVGSISVEAEADPPDDSVAAFLYGWLEVELALRELVTQQLGESRAEDSLSGLIHSAQTAGLLSDHNTDRVLKLLDIRNRVAHGQARFDAASLREAIREADRLRDDLQARLLYR